MGKFSYRLLFPVALLLCPVALHAAEDPVELLNSIRQALLEESVDNGVRVVSSGYVDSSGALVESTAYTSALDVSGVRVLSYLQDEGDTAEPAIDRLPEGLQSWVRGVCEIQASAPGRNASYRVSIQTPALPEVAIDGTAAIAGLLQNSLSADGAWTLFPDAARSYGSRYEDLLYGRKSASATDYRMLIAVEQLESASDLPGLLPALSSWGRAARSGIHAVVTRNPVAEIAPRAGTMPVGLRIRFELADLVDAGRSVVHVHHVLLDQDASSLVRASELDAVIAAFTEGLAAWQALLPPATGCSNDPAYLHAGAESGELVLRAGSANGISPDDRFLLLGRKLLQAGALNADWTTDIAIGKVESLDMYEARLRPVTATGEPRADFHYAIRF